MTPRRAAPPPGPAPPPSVLLAAGAGARLWPSLPALFGANLVFLACCGPCGLLALLGLPTLALAVAPLTVGPGVVSLMTAAARALDGMSDATPASPWSLRSVRTGGALVTALLLAWHAQLLALRVVTEHAAAPAAVGLWAAQVAVLVFGALVAVHALPLVGLHGQGALEATRNGFVLAVRHPGPTIAALGLVGAAVPLVWALRGAPLIILPAAVAVFLVGNTRRLAESGGSTS